MKLCHCGGKLNKQRLAKYVDKRLGLPGVSITLFNAVVMEKCALCEEVAGVTISNLEGLVATVALTRVKHPARLNGGEILFLRKAMEITGKELAAKLGVNEQTMSRWINDQDPIGGQSEKALRRLVGDELKDRAPLIEFKPDDIWSMTIAEIHARPLRFEFTLVTEHKDEEQQEEELWKQGGRVVNE
jgi:transcriptional regulator with XRE-family HTH domain